MLKVDQYDFIRTGHRVYGKKIKQIARETVHESRHKEINLRRKINFYLTMEGVKIGLSEGVNFGLTFRKKKKNASP